MYRPPFQNRNQLHFFQSLDELHDDAKNHSPMKESCATMASSIESDHALSTPHMKPKPFLLPLSFDDDGPPDQAIAPLNPTAAGKTTHAIQDHRPRVATAESDRLQRPAIQKLLTFDDDPARHSTPRVSSGEHRNNETKPTPVVASATIQPSLRDEPSRYAGNNRIATPNPSGQRFHEQSVARSRGTRKGRAHTDYQPLFDVLDQPQALSPLPIHEPTESSRPKPTPVSSGEKAKAHDILEAIRIVNRLDTENRPATLEERNSLKKFGGFGAVALSLFPDPMTGQYKDANWKHLGEELQSLLTPEDYDSAKRTTFSAFYTSRQVIAAMQSSLPGLGVPDQALILEPGCGVGNFLSQAAENHRYIGVELDKTSGRIARAIHPEHDIRIQNFRDTKLADDSLDAVIGNVPFANIKLDYKGQRFSLHDYFFAKSLDAVKPGGVMALVTSHFTLDKKNAAIRETLAAKADFIGAIRLPSDAFKREGTKVVTDIVFLRKREENTLPNHIDSAWLETGPLQLDGSEVDINRYFLNHPEMVLGNWTRENQLYGDEGFSVASNGVLEDQLREAMARLPSFQTMAADLPTTKVHLPHFTRPPPLRHITEGSMYVGDDRTIYQIENGLPQAVTHGSTALKSDGTMMGKRLAALIGLRDAARLVLQSQNEGWPESERNATRQDLSRLYDRFVTSYGAINKTTFSETKDGTVIRRMPNLAKFREDPDSQLVLSLEDYDEVTDRATKAAIFGQDVVGKKPDIIHVQSAEEGLLVSLNHKGGIDLPFIASLYGKPESQVISELGDLIYLNPESREWETADVYLSGNVRAKLKIAEEAGPEFQRHAEVLKHVQPPDLLPGEIDANLGSPWLPVEDIQAFAAELFRVSPSSISIGHLKKDALWSVDANYAAEQSVAATSEFGTPRANGTGLFELALNMKSPIIYDTIRTDQGEERIVNQNETLAAKEKQRLIKDKFRQWIFSDPDRTERLVRIYNDTYNNLRPRLFDGSHLDFPGMNQTISLRQHQKDAIWRTMSSGNTLLAHAVGAGKTYTMAAAGMKLKQAGLIQKPMYVVPNHMLEQFSREFMQLFPNAHLLVASKEDMSKDRRKQLTAKIASGNWDGIIVTHSSFERIGMSSEYQEKFLKEQIEEYTNLLTDTISKDTSRKHRNLIKTIEKQKAAREQRLQELKADNKKDDGLVFDELGVDHVFIDESHYFKNLETSSKMDRVAGIQTGGSQRSFDLFMKARYLDEMHHNHGLTFATGTPISNTMVEMYNVQRFLDPHGLADRGIDHFDAWAANFGEVVESMEISPDGASLRPRSRFAKFNNLPELQQMFRSFADVQTAEMLDLPRPKLRGGKPTTIACPMTLEQATIQANLVERFDRIRSSKIDPRVDNALAITTDGRKLALDARMLDPMAIDDPHSKINDLVGNVTRIWRDSAGNRGTQLIFCDMGVHPTPWGFSAYDDIIQKLVARGIPRDQIASIGDADSDVKKQVMFEKVRNGSIRILLGSTQKMGTGTNVQKRLKALHHLDAPWKPSEVEQRDGRILRQGNINPEVDIYRYVTEGSFDAFMWQALETKARFISQIMTGNTGIRRADDIGGQELSYAEVKAIATGNPAVLTLAEADAELQRLAVLRKNHTDDQYIIRRKVRELPELIDSMELRKAAIAKDLATLQSHAKAGVTIGDRQIPADKLMDELGAILDRLPESVNQVSKRVIGNYHGLRFGIELNSQHRSVFLEGALFRAENLHRDHTGPRAVLNALKRMEESYEEQLQRTTQDLALYRQQKTDFESRMGQPFTQEDYCHALTTLRDELRLSLSDKPVAEGEARRPSSEIVHDLEKLRSTAVQSNDQEHTSPKAPPTYEEPIYRQLTKRLEAIGASIPVHTSSTDTGIDDGSQMPWQVTDANQFQRRFGAANLLDSKATANGRF